jgi:hypothetical protein
MKNTYKLSTVVYLLGLLLLVACGKDDSITKKPEHLLTKVTSISDNSQSIINYEYDSNNNLVKSFSESDLGMMETTYVYDDNGRMIQKLYYLNGNLIEKKEYLRTDTSITEQGYLIGYKNTWIQTEEKRVLNIDKDQNIVKMQYFQMQENNWVSAFYFLYFWESGNMVKEEFWASSSGKLGTLKNNSTYSNELIHTMNCTYDNKNNPNKEIYNLFPTPSSKNNVIKYEQVRDNIIIWESEYYFEYDEKNYPTKKTDDSWVTYYEYLGQ